jgi:hypothetical protein
MHLLGVSVASLGAPERLRYEAATIERTIARPHGVNSVMQRPSRRDRDHRIAVQYEGVLTTADEQRVAVVVRDISANGFRIELEEELLLGEHVRLQVGKQPEVHAEIRWCLGREAGGVFLQPFNEPKVSYSS